MRHKVRVGIKYGTKKYIDFAKQNAGLPNAKVKTYLGHCCKNLVVVLNESIAYKFPLTEKKYHDAIKEKMFMDAFRKVSPVPLAQPEVLQYHGTDVLKYQFIKGKVITELSPKQTVAHAAKIGWQLGDFIYAIGMSDPRELKKLKPTQNAKPEFMFGWCHNDIGANFILNPDTMEIVGFIDWATARFCDFKPDFVRALRHLDHRGHGAVLIQAMMRYIDLYNSQEKK